MNASEFPDMADAFNTTENTQTFFIPSIINNYGIYGVVSCVNLIYLEPDAYSHVLNERSSRALRPDFISQVQSLQKNEVLISNYIHLRDDLNIGDTFTLTILNMTYPYTINITNEINHAFTIKGYLDNLPGYDGDPNLVFDIPGAYELYQVYAIVSPLFNFSTEVPDYLYSRVIFGKGVLREEVLALLPSWSYDTLSEKIQKFNTEYDVILGKFYDQQFTLWIAIFGILEGFLVYWFFTQNEALFQKMNLIGSQKQTIKKLISFTMLGMGLFIMILGIIGIIGGMCIIWIRYGGFVDKYFQYPVYFSSSLLDVLNLVIMASLQILFIGILHAKLKKFKLQFSVIRKSLVE